MAGNPAARRTTILNGMAAPAHKFTAVTTALLVLVAHALCVCRTASAARAVPADVPAAHACCKQPSQPDPRPTPDHPSHHGDGHCSHCDGLAVVAPTGNDTGLAFSPAFQLDAVWTTSADEFATPQRSAAEAAFVEPAFLSPPTLLRLRCALNL